MKFKATLAGALLATTAWAGMAAAQTEITMWYHGGGNEAESALIDRIVADFNASNEDYTVVF